MTPRVWSFLLMAGLLVACSSSTRAEPTQPPTPNLAHPVGIIAIGHSGLTGEGTAGEYQPNPAASWATGDLPNVRSVYLRLVAARPETKGHVANTAVGGATADTLVPQARAALATVPVPTLAIIETVDNDINCAGSNVAEVGRYLAAALALIHKASPNTKILVIGQPGRPSVSFIQALIAFDPSTKSLLEGNDDCAFLDPQGNLRPSGFQKLSAVIDRYEAENARVCALVPNCATDGGVRKQWIDKIKYYASPYTHLNQEGQAAEAEQVWPVVQRLLGL